MTINRSRNARLHGTPGPARETSRPRPVVNDHFATLERLARWSTIVALGILAILISATIAVQIAERGQVRAGIHAFGVDLGGMTRDEATEALATARDERLGAPLTLTDGEQSWTVTAADLGLVIDVDRTVDAAFEEGRSGFGPSRLALLWYVRSRPWNVGADAIAVQSSQLQAQIAQIAAEIQQDKIDPVLTLDVAGGTTTYVEAQTGRDLDVERTSKAILDALSRGESSIPLAINETQPIATNADYENARRQLDRIIDGPIELAAGSETWTLEPRHILNRLTILPAADGQPASLQIDQTWIDAVVREISMATDRSAQSPHIWWGADGGLVKTADGQPSQDMDEEQSRGLILAAFLGESEANRVELPVATGDAPQLPADLNSLGISTLLAQASTPYGGGLPERMHNIELAATLLNGAVVLPGQTFSFNGEIGPMTTDAGFQIGYGIAEENGELRTVPAEAGGICQVATTVFQPVFWTGYEIEQRGPHSYWISNYAYNGYVGVDAAVEPTVGLDLKWTNNSSTAVLIEAVADGQNFMVNLYGTPPPWRVEIDQPVVTNTVPANEEIVYEPSPTIPEGTTRQIERAQDGFDASVVRRVIEGDDVRTLDLVSQYGPSRNVVLVGSGDGEESTD